jgi:hypothetical protein
MSENNLEEVKKENTEKVKNKKDSHIVCVGLDCGTMNLVCARSDLSEIKITRNVFLPIDKDEVNISNLSNINYIESDDGELFIIGSDAFEFANLFGQSVSRPMEKGLISSSEFSAVDILTLMIQDLIGETKDKEVYCSYSIPAEPIDEDRTITFHEKTFARILNKIGVNYNSVNEGMAVIFPSAQKKILVELQ